jgi:ubiquinone/menaquinone biosynthesis C-methylase UbiE
MLLRILEPEIMDTSEDADEYEAMDHRVVNEAFAEAVIALVPAVGSLLDIGTGPGHIPLLLAERIPGLRVVAIDLGTHMLERARNRVAERGLTEHVEILARDAKETGFPEHSFDAVVSNSLIHHIPEPLTVLREIARIAKPGAALFLKDLRRPTTTAELDALVALHASDCTPYQRRLFRDSLQAALRVEEVEELCREAGLVGVSTEPSSDRHWEIRRAFAPGRRE